VVAADAEAPGGALGVRPGHRPAQGFGHDPDCLCVRCSGFQPGNNVPVRHGAYSSPLKLEARAAEIANELRPLLPLYSPVDEPALRLAAITLVRVERAAAALEEIDARATSEIGTYLFEQHDKVARLRSDLRSWISTCDRLLDRLGMNPTSRARLASDLAVTQRTITAQTLRERYGPLEAA
jgi:hypothetical protein